MRFQVPQFIEVEDKVIGPLSFRQFVYIAGGIGLSFLLYIFLPLIVAAPLILAVLALSGALAFYKINNKPFVNLIESSFKYFFGSKLYVWKKSERKPTPSATGKPSEEPSLYVPKLSDSKLKDLAWSLDVHEETSNIKNEK